jgi:hypothetical protein
MFADPKVAIVRIVVQNGDGVVLQSFDFPDGRFRVEFHGPRTDESSDAG